MGKPDNLHPEAAQMLKEADWHWDPHKRAFQEARDPTKETTEEYYNRPPAIISYEELDKHNLLRKSASEAEQKEGLRWLRGKLSGSN